MELNNNIKLFNRYGDNLYLEQIEDNLYKLTGEDLEFCRMGAGDDEWKTIEFVDPSGGPFMMVNNFEITTENGDKKILREIIRGDEGFILRFE